VGARLLASAHRLARTAPLAQAIEAAARAELDEARHQRRQGRGGDHGHEQRLLPLRAPGRRCGLPVHAGPAAHERHRRIPASTSSTSSCISLAVSAVNGCGLCIESHEKLLRKHEVGREAIQSAVRIAAVIHAVARVLEQQAAVAGVDSPPDGALDPSS
jgi:AhpD family alkylhydroperoxidase